MTIHADNGQAHPIDYQIDFLSRQLAAADAARRHAQATVGALTKELDEAITAHHNIVKQFDELTCCIGCDYDPETETWVSGKPPYLSAGTNEVEACKAAVDALRSVAIVLQAALDADREKVAQLSEENNNLVVELAELRETVTDLKCSFHGRLSTAQTDLSQLQALLRAYFVAKEAALKTSEDQDYVEWRAKYRAYTDAQGALEAALTPAPRQRQVHSCEIPGCVSCANPEEGGDGE